MAKESLGIGRTLGQATAAELNRAFGSASNRSAAQRARRGGRTVVSLAGASKAQLAAEARKRGIRLGRGGLAGARG